MIDVRWGGQLPAVSGYLAALGGSEEGYPNSVGLRCSGSYHSRNQQVLSHLPLISYLPYFLYRRRIPTPENKAAGWLIVSYRLVLSSS